MKESMLWNKLKDTFAESSNLPMQNSTWLGSGVGTPHSAISTESVIIPASFALSP